MTRAGWFDECCAPSAIQMFSFIYLFKYIQSFHLTFSFHERCDWGPFFGLKVVFIYFPLSCLSQEVSSLWALGQLVIGTIMQAGAISLQTQRFVEVSQPLNFQLRGCSANLTCSNMNVRCLSDVTLVCVYLCFCFLRYRCPHRSTKLEEGLHYANCQEGNSRDLSWSMGDCHCRWRCFKF